MKPGKRSPEWSWAGRNASTVCCFQSVFIFGFLHFWSLFSKCIRMDEVEAFQLPLFSSLEGFLFFNWKKLFDNSLKNNIPWHPPPAPRPPPPAFRVNAPALGPQSTSGTEASERLGWEQHRPGCQTRYFFFVSVVENICFLGGDPAFESQSLENTGQESWFWF